MNLERIKAELNRLANGPSASEKPGGAGTVRFIASCPLGATDVLGRVKIVLRIVDEVSLTGWLNEKQWRNKLPTWFTERCVPSASLEEAESRLAWEKKLPPEEQVRIMRDAEWSLSAWLYWLEPERREWCWWDAQALDDVDHIIVAVEVDGWPFAWGALRWLFKVAGASELNPEQ